MQSVKSQGQEKKKGCSRKPAHSSSGTLSPSVLTMHWESHAGWQSKFMLVTQIHVKVNCSVLGRKKHRNSRGWVGMGVRKGKTSEQE